MTEDEIVGWHHQKLNGYEFERAPGNGEGQGSLACCSPWGHKQLDMTQRLNNNNGLDEKVLNKILANKNPKKYILSNVPQCIPGMKANLIFKSQ